jgi:hypothetical protein
MSPPFWLASRIHEIETKEGVNQVIAAAHLASAT